MMKAQRWATSRWSGYLVFLVVPVVVTAIFLQASPRLARHLLDRAIAHQGIEAVARLDRVMSSAARTLTVIDRSAHAACSPADMALLRSELMRSKFTRDLGRLNDKNLTCTTMLGVLPTPLAPRRPGTPLDGGLLLYWAEPLLLDPMSRGMMIRTKRSSLLVDLDDLGGPAPPGLGAVISLRDSPTTWVVGLNKRGLHDYVEAMEEQAGEKEGERFCSERFPLCATVVSARTAQVRAMRNATWLLAAAGVLLGSGLGALALATHRRWSALASRIRRALADGRFTLNYQPILCLGEAPQIVSAEALIRWADGPVSPEVFIAEAERSGMIAEITAFVLDTVLKEMRSLFDTLPDFRVAINVSSPELVDGSLMATLHRLWPAGLARHHVGFELTERSTAELQDIFPELERLRELGHPIYIDDFGTGYSSLAQLQHLPVDYIKVDRSLLPRSARQRNSIIPEILAIARRLEVGLVFEGLETREQVQLLECTEQEVFAQGWYFGHPETADKLKEHLDRGIAEPE
ncbi:EAL domain-containing protein [Pseudomonas aeruginosa]